MPDFRRGAEAIATAQKESKSGGSFKAFTPEFFWKDGDEKFLLFLNPVRDIPTTDLIEFIPVKAKKADGDTYTRYERTISRTDPVIGEDSDPMEDEWQGKGRARCVAVAVELEPTYTEVKGRKRPTGFSVKTREFERRIRDEEGELTDQYESVIAPEVAIVHASPHNFFNIVTSYDENEAPIEETPVKITRIGSDKNTSYSLLGYPEQEIDLSALVQNIDNVYYLANELDVILPAIEGASDDQEAAAIIGAAMLDKRLEELVDQDRYDDLFKGITETLDKFGGKKKAAAKKERPARASQRSRSHVGEDENNVISAEEPAEEKPKATRGSAAAGSDKIAAMRKQLADRTGAATA